MSDELADIANKLARLRREAWKASVNGRALKYHALSAQIKQLENSALELRSLELGDSYR